MAICVLLVNLLSSMILDFFFFIKLFGGPNDWGPIELCCFSTTIYAPTTTRRERYGHGLDKGLILGSVGVIYGYGCITYEYSGRHDRHGSRLFWCRLLTLGNGFEG